MRILIVGAGPTGLTAAVELARHGIVAEVVDQKQEASTASAAPCHTATDCKVRAS